MPIETDKDVEEQWHNKRDYICNSIESEEIKQQVRRTSVIIRFEQTYPNISMRYLLRKLDKLQTKIEKTFKKNCEYEN